ncbi:4Fe-4S cluster-binding domain-containing protein, partial [Salmonella enterica subsp. enterica serovar Anatum]|nr:4Fe-4S cluster-binding domain-containing protein [Salmonella enterica subsp. enterica serovar Anatum]
ECSGKDIWVWTGYKLDELNAAQMQVVDLINVLVDGKFVQDLNWPFTSICASVFVRILFVPTIRLKPLNKWRLN